MSRLIDLVKYEVGINNLAKLGRFRSKSYLDSAYEVTAFGMKGLANIGELVLLYGAVINDIPSGEYKEAIGHLSIIPLGELLKFILPDSPFIDYLRDKYYGWRFRKLHKR